MRKFLSGILSLLLLMGLLPAAYAEEPALGVTYEIFVASFQDSGGDGIGDLQGIIDRLDYLQSLGVRQIWLMPIHPSPSYHKYDVLDYYAVDPSYGTLDDFDRLTAACKERGIKFASVVPRRVRRQILLPHGQNDRLVRFLPGGRERTAQNQRLFVVV